MHWSIGSLTLVDELMVWMGDRPLALPGSLQHNNIASEQADSTTECALHVFILPRSLTSDAALLHAADERMKE